MFEGSPTLAHSTKSKPNSFRVAAAELGPRQGRVGGSTPPGCRQKFPEAAASSAEVSRCLSCGTGSGGSAARVAGAERPLPWTQVRSLLRAVRAAACGDPVPGRLSAVASTR